MFQRHQFTGILEFTHLGTLAIGTLIVFAASTAFAQTQYKDIKVLGTSNAVSRPGPKNGDELKRVFERNRADYEKVLREAGWPGNSEDLFRAVQNNQFSEAQYPVGHTFEWMAVRRRGIAVPSGPVRWAGTAPFEAFEIRVESNDRAYRFLIPKACGNLALVSEGPTQRQLEEERRQQELRALRPTLRVQAPNLCTGANVTVDVGASGTIPEGATVQLTMTRPNGQRETLNATRAGGGFRWTGKLDEAGSYTFTALIQTSAGPTQETTERINLEPCPPTCNITLTPPPADPAPKRGKASIGVDTCGSSARVGSIASRSVRIHHTPVDAPEQLIETLSLDTECRGSFLLPEYGSYRFEATVTDDRGMTATCQADYNLVEPESQIEPFFTVFAGKERRLRELDPVTGEPVDFVNAFAKTTSAAEVLQGVEGGRCAPLLGGTVGLAIPFAERGAQFFGQGGVAINLRDAENTTVFADVGIDKLFEGGGFLGGGVGVWDLFHGDTIDGSIFVHGGVDINEKLQWNVEGRLFMSELGEIENNYAILTGIRYFWKR
jgi:hypothetical protein